MIQRGMKILGGILWTFILSWQGYANQDGVIYGDDNRKEAEDSSAIYQDWARSTAAMINHDKMKTLENGLFIEIKMEKPPIVVCEDEPFADQIMAANCSGFLVAPDLIVTAGHCMHSPTSCQDYQWVFDYRKDFIGDSDAPLIQVGNVYSCKKVVAKVLDPITKMDYALIRLDRRVRDRLPLPIRKEGLVKKGEHMVVLGHPSGLPLKVTDQSFVRSTDNSSFFVINSDTFQGNSGSPVINAESGRVEGILVRGDKDYNFDIERQCYSVQHCEENECRGEDVTRITKIPDLVVQD